nr:MAG TPA: hypothetical protein [Caudoviricetes sp.]
MYSSPLYSAYILAIFFRLPYTFKLAIYKPPSFLDIFVFFVFALQACSHEIFDSGAAVKVQIVALDKINNFDAVIVIVWMIHRVASIFFFCVVGDMVSKQIINRDTQCRSYLDENLFARPTRFSPICCFIRHVSWYIYSDCISKIFSSSIPCFLPKIFQVISQRHFSHLLQPFSRHADDATSHF